MVLITLRNIKIAETSKCFLKYNFCNFKHYDINIDLLEKQLIKNIANIQYLPILQYIDDRKACYDIQLPDIWIIAEKFFGIDDKETKLLCQLLNNFRHFLSMGYGIFSESYGRTNNLLGGIGQGNIVSG